MKIFKSLPILGFSAVVVSCGTFENLNKPISDSSFNPLDTPGMRSVARDSSDELVSSNDYGFNNGEIVEVVISNTAFYDKVPKAGDSYKRILTVGETLTVTGGEKDFIKVLTDKGETGYVSSVMVVTKGSLTDANLINDNVTVVGANETPIVPDIAPDPLDPNAPLPEEPAEEEPEADPVAPKPSDDPPASDVPKPELPEPKPVEPSLPNKPSSDPVVPELEE